MCGRTNVTYRMGLIRTRKQNKDKQKKEGREVGRVECNIGNDGEKDKDDNQEEEEVEEDVGNTEIKLPKQMFRDNVQNLSVINLVVK